MRIIDADDLLERIKKEHANQAEQSPSGLYGAVPLAYADCYGMVFIAPTIKAEQVVHGEWKCQPLDKFRKYECKCSACGWAGMQNYDAYVDPSDFNFCPNCGARMDAEEVEG